MRRFEQITGRRPRILIAKMGQDGHDRWGCLWSFLAVVSLPADALPVVVMSLLSSLGSVLEYSVE